ncbi:hypothetical protein SVIOM342S_10175 [Streptomyces violaceorubidus]
MVQVRHGGRHVGHGGEADAQVGVGVHGDADAEGAADGGQLLRVAQSAPVVVVGEHDLYGALGERLLDLGERRHAHVGRERHPGPRGDLGHRRGAERGVLQVLQDVPQLRRDLERGLHGPGAVGVQAQRVSGERLGERLDGGDLLFGREDAALELEGGEAVPLGEAAGLLDHAGRVEGGAPVVLLRGHALGVTGPLVEEVGAVLHGVADLAAEQGVHGQAERLAEGVEAGDLEAGEDGQAQLVGGLDAAQPADVHLPGDPGGVDGDLVGEGEQAVEVRDLTADQLVGERAGQFQVLVVAVGLADAGDAVGGLHLDDQTGGVRLVHALGVEQGRVGDQDRRQVDGRDGQVAGHRAAPTRSSPVVSRVLSSARSAGDGSVRGARTGPTGQPRSRAAAFTRDTAYPGTRSRSSTSGT